MLLSSTGETILTRSICTIIEASVTCNLRFCYCNVKQTTATRRRSRTFQWHNGVALSRVPSTDAQEHQQAGAPSCHFWQYKCSRLSCQQFLLKLCRSFLCCVGCFQLGILPVNVAGSWVSVCGTLQHVK